MAPVKLVGAKAQVALGTVEEEAWARHVHWASVAAADSGLVGAEQAAAEEMARAMAAGPQPERAETSRQRSAHGAA